MKFVEIFVAWLKTRRQLTTPQQPCEPGPDEFAKLQRTLRRQTLLVDQQTEQLTAIRDRLASIDQALLNLRVAHEHRDSKNSVSEADWLTVLDAIDRAATAQDLSDSSRKLLDEAVELIQGMAGLQPVASIGLPPDTLGCRILEVVPEPEAAGFKVTRIVRQGYLRNNGAPIRDAVVIVSGSAI